MPSSIRGIIRLPDAEAIAISHWHISESRELRVTQSKKCLTHE
jgi:hypothetical protein